MSDDAKLSIASYNARAVRALEEIQRREGFKTEAQFLRRLEELTGIAIPKSTYNRWINGDVREMPAWPLLAFAEALDYSLDDVVNLASPRLDQIERRLTALEDKQR